jgi:3-oxoadipate enol-lactonase
MPLVFLHPGIADSGIWEPQWSLFATAYRVVRCDLEGFGHSPMMRPQTTYAADVAALLDETASAPAAVIGASLGGRIALELAVARPDLVRALVLAGASLPGQRWSAEVRAYGEAEDQAMANGDLEAATELNLHMWVDGPRRRPADVSPAVRSKVAGMQRRAFEHQAPWWDVLAEVPLVADVGQRLEKISAPTLVLAGEEDADEIKRIARRLAAGITRGTSRAHRRCGPHPQPRAARRVQRAGAGVSPRRARLGRLARLRP